MIIHNPRTVRFGDIVLENVAAVMIDRVPQRTVEEFGELGPYAKFADVPQQRVHIRIMQQSIREGVNAPRPGDQALLSFHTASTGNDAGRRRITATAVVLSIQHELSIRSGAVRAIKLAAISTTGASDPITITAM